MKVGSDRVVFGHMHEDHSLELSLTDRLPLMKALVIASGGDLVFALAGAKVEVTAVDSNPAQIALVRLKAGCPADLMDLCFCGSVDRLFRWGGPLLSWLFGWPEMRPGRIRVFLLDRLEGFLPWVASLLHGPRVAARLDRHAIQLIRRRLELAMKKPDADHNPLLQVLLGNRFGPEVPTVWSERGIALWSGEIGRINLIAADFSQVLHDSAAGSQGLISVSNLPDVMESAAWDRLVGDAARALTPGGFLVVRSMLRETLQSNGHDEFDTEEIPPGDTSPLCPVIWVGRKR